MIRKACCFGLLLALGLFLLGCDEEFVIPPEPPVVLNVLVSPGLATLQPGQKCQLSAYVFGSGPITQNVTFTSSDENVGTVSTSGLFTANQVGTATVTVASVDDPTKVRTVTLEVIAPPPAPPPLTLSPQSAEVPTEGAGSVTIKFSAYNAAGAEHPVTWAIQSGGGSIDANGVLTYLSIAGPIVITGTCAIDQVTQATATVTVK
jgi:hypothetical protein